MIMDSCPVKDEMIRNYFSSLINRFYKILPLREKNEKTLIVYVESLQFEMIGAGNLIEAIGYDGDFLTLLAILQHLIDDPEYPVESVKREVFKSIRICEKLRDKKYPGV